MSRRLTPQTPWAVGSLLPSVGRARMGGSASVTPIDVAGTRIALKVAHEALSAPRLAAEARAMLGASDLDVWWVGWVRPQPGGHVVTGAEPLALPAFAMDWVAGATLAASTPQDARGVVHDVAESLAGLHAAGRAHGDVSRANVVVDAARATLIDLGLTCPVGTTVPLGATLRYLDRAGKLGDARSRDLLALGVLIAELHDAAVRAALDGKAIDEARAWAAVSTAPLAHVARALLCPEPSARPEAAWVAEMSRPLGAPFRRHVGIVRGAYLRAREADLDARPTPQQPSWLVDVAARRVECDALAGNPRPPSTHEMPAMDALGVSRWLVGLVGPAAVDWPVDRLLEVSERELDLALEQLASDVAPGSWTLDHVERAIRGEPPAFAEALDDREAEVARVALALSRVPVDPEVLVAVERDASLPDAITWAASDALRLRGEVARARALSGRARSRAPDALDAEIARRAGDRNAARALAEEAVQLGAPRARAVLARLALDAGDVDAARRTLVGGEGAACMEVAVLCAAATNDPRAARAACDRGRAIARTPEERARLAGALGYALAESAPADASAAYQEAADHAARAGAVEEEASYLTGAAATAVSEGRLASALAAGTRAALLWEARGRPDRAARAYLACASAHAVLGRAEQSETFAALAESRARDGGDERTVLFAALARHDASLDDGAPRRLARDVAGLAAPLLPSDVLRVAARRGDARSPGDARARLDEIARDVGTDLGARLDWWGARAKAVLDVGATDRADDVVAALVELSGSTASIEAKGPALTAGFRLASTRADGEAAARLAQEARAAARALVERAGPSLGAAAREVPWVATWFSAPSMDDAAASLEGVGAEQARELLRVVRSLEGRERLGDLLDRIVDALVAWTGVERGFLLVPSPDGALRPRAARRLGRDDLATDRLALSQTLARRALQAGEPVVAVDASGEMSDVHASVHALRLRSVLAVPLVARGEVLGVVYLDDRVRRGAFGPRELAWARTVAALAAMVLAEARERVLLRREARRSRRARERLAERLAERETLLGVAEAAIERRARPGAFSQIVGQSAALERVVQVAERVARSDVPALVLGESGSGKELFARAIHDASARREAPFVSENCSAIPEPLLESTLFGHERGAFTGADRPKLGLLQAADGGTLFLDEVGEMSLAMQAKLLRVLEDGMVRPVGGTRARKVDVRVIAATHRDLEAMVAARTFREDLYYRLHIVVIALPPLRDRRDDVPLLVRALVARHAPGRAVRVSRSALDRLTSFDWPGNVRQLDNEIRRALVLADDDIDVTHLSEAIAGSAREPASDGEGGWTLRGRIDALETSLVRDALGRTGGNLTRAAKELGVSRYGLQKMMKRLAIERPFGSEPEPPPEPPRRRRAARGVGKT